CRTRHFFLRLAAFRAATKPHHLHSLLRRNALPDFRAPSQLLAAFPLRDSASSVRKRLRNENYVFHSCNLTTIPCGVFLLTPRIVQGRMRAIKFAVPARSPVLGLSCGSSGQTFSFRGPRRAAGPPGALGDPTAQVSEGVSRGLSELCGLWR